MYRCIIVDDEPHAIEGLKRCIGHIENLEIVSAYTDPIKALIQIACCGPVDLIILDIDMPGITGLDLAKEIRQKTDKLIFTTAHSKYGYEAYQVDAAAYLLKPYTVSRFISTFNRLFPSQTQPPEEAGEKEDFIFIKSKEDNLKLVKVRLRDIIAVESKLNYVKVHTRERTVITYMTLTEIANKLLAYKGFIQFQRSFVIAKAHIDYVEGNSVIMINGIQITVGTYYRKNFNEFIAENLLKTGRRSS